MKRTFKSLLAAAALAFASLSSLLAPSTAHAAGGGWNVVINHWGVSCTQRTTGSYPDNGRYFYCGTDVDFKTDILSATQSALLTYPSVLTSLSMQNIDIYVFTNAEDYGKYFWTGPSAPTAADLQTFWNDNRGIEGSSFPLSKKIVLFEKIADPEPTHAYPAYIQSDPDKLTFVAFHEMGHSFDFLTNFATGSKFKMYTAIDQSYMNATDPDPAFVRKENRYYLDPTKAPKPTEEWKELWAEEFAMQVRAGTGLGTQRIVDSDVIEPYFKCGRAYVRARLISSNNPVQADFDAMNTPSDSNVYARCVVAPPNCFEQGLTLNNYPLDGNNVAGATHAFRCNNSVTNVKPSDARTNELFVTALQAMPANVKTKLKSQNVKFYFFNNRQEANSYFDSISAPQHVSTAVCASTGSDASGTNVIVAIYDNCIYTTGNVVNPDLKRTAHHEAGEAFGIALSPATPKFTLSGFATLFSSDKVALTPPNWSTMTQAQRYAYVCNVYSVSAPSTLEKQYGANLNGTTSAPIGAVCSGSTPATFYQPVGKTPTIIADDKLPMFTGSARELWGEVFVVILDSSTSPSAYLPITDRVIGINQTPTRSFNCTRGVVQYYIDHLTTIPATAPVGQVSLQSLSCNQTPGAL